MPRFLQTHSALFLAVLLTLSSMTLSAHANGIAVITPTPAIFINLNGDRLQALEVGRQVIITSTFTNNDAEERSFVGLLEVRDSDGVTVFLAWQSGAIEPLGNKTIGVSWSAPEPSNYSTRVFAITDFEQPQVLSYVAEFQIEARQITR